MRAQLNLPNVLTLLRIVLVPLVVFGILQETGTGDVIAAALFTIAAASDWFDGHLARSRNLITDFGKVMDPVADKLLITATLVTLSAFDRMSWIATVIVLAREFAVSGLRLYAADRGQLISASRYGKLKTVVQAVVVLIVLVVDPARWVEVLVWAMVAVTVLTGLDYFVNTGKRIDSE